MTDAGASAAMHTIRLAEDIARSRRCPCGRMGCDLAGVQDHTDEAWRALIGKLVELLRGYSDDHFVTFDVGGWWVVEHSFDCGLGALAGTLDDTCEFIGAVRAVADDDPALLGRWRITGVTEGLPDLERA